MAHIMPLTAFLAQLFGIYILLISIGMLIRRQSMIEMMTTVVGQPALIYVFAMLRLLIDLAIVLACVRLTNNILASVARTKR